MVATRNWKRVGVLGLGLAPYGLCIQCDTYMRIRAEDSEEENREKMMRNDDISEINLQGYQLEDPLLKKLGKWFPNAEKVYFEDIPAGGTFPDKEGADEEVAPCEKAKSVMLRGSCNGSPTMIEHLKLLCPNATDLKFWNSKALPIHSAEDAKACQDQGLKMEKIVDLLLLYHKDKMSKFLFENLGVFPKVENLILRGYLPESAIVDIQKTNLVLSHVKKLEGYGFPADQGFLSRLTTVFPSVEEFVINREAFERMVEEREGSMGSPYSFEKLTKLEIYFEKGNLDRVVNFGKRTSKVFPFLSYITLSFFSTPIILRHKDIFPVQTVTTVELQRPPVCLPDFFHELFPNLDSLIVARSGLKQLSGERSFFHPQLKHLDISGSEELEGILEGMEGPQSSSDGVPVGGLHLPCLESLNICGSFECKLPGRFLQGCSEIKTLKMSVDPKRYDCDSEGSWWEFLEALLALKEIHVGIVSPPSEEGMDASDDAKEFSKRVLRDLENAKRYLAGHILVHLYKGRYPESSNLILLSDLFASQARSEATAGRCIIN